MPSTHYIGKASHLAVMGELPLHGYNVAMPEIDKGDDIFVVRDETGAMWCLQVKTALGRQYNATRRYQFRIRANTIMTAQNPEQHFVFVMRDEDIWRFLVMDRAVLRNYVINQGLGSLNYDHRQLAVSLRDDKTVICSKQDLTNHLEDWDTWPEI